MDEVLNVSNLMLHSYGENRYVGSIDVEVDASMTALKIGRLSHRIKKHAAELGVEITSVGVTGTDMNDPETNEIQDRMIRTATRYKSIKRLQSFVIDREEQDISFFLVPDYSVRNRDEEIERFKKECAALCPEMHLDIRTAIDM